MNAAEMTMDESDDLFVLAAMAVLLMDGVQPVGAVRLREVWPIPSPWRWAPATGS